MEMKSPQPCPSTVNVRRNPHRKARATPLTNPTQLRSHSTSSSTLTQISSFPIQEILAEEILPKPPSNLSSPSPLPSLDSVTENLRVYLRIRPLVPLRNSDKRSVDQNLRLKQKNVWPQNPSKNKKISKKSNESCITVNEDFHSVTLSPPLQLQETKRIKSEVYEGFSHVFSADSTQNEVYEKMVNPLVKDFLRGKSGMLAALGPTGSGKTHTVFGTPREPGMVPLTLQRIFESDQGCNSQSKRRFYLSIFEICSERGKNERICDLTSDRLDLYMQQTVIKGLQEVLVHDALEAEQLIARALMKRSTAMTNANSQSSRSQCIINIRRGTNSSDEETDEQSNSAVLSIVDLAGAEREKRTGNQGARLAESNFINNTSMVFGLCLRSLLEHQKNPKRALQKHFQNSLLTRYLRDYLEGKKKMTLILTVKSGEEDYLDASYLLRQSLPYMKIKFTNIETQSNVLCHKRRFPATSGESKRMKLSGLQASAFEEKNFADENQPPDEDELRSCSANFKNDEPPNLSSDDLMKKDRTHEIMKNFAKTLWSVLKQQNEKLKVAESKLQILGENLRNEKEKSIKMEKELNDLRSTCTCSKRNSMASTVVRQGESLESTVQVEVDPCSGIDERDVKVLSPNKYSPEKGSSFPRQQQDIYSQVSSWKTSTNPSGLKCIGDKQEELESMVRITEDEATSALTGVSNYCSQIRESFPGTVNGQEDSGESNSAVDKHLDPNSDHTGYTDISGDDNSASEQPSQQLEENKKDSLDLRVSTTVVELTKQKYPVKVPESEKGPDPSCNSSKKEKPRRRIMPASSILVGEISTLGGDEFDKQRGQQSGRKLATSQRQRTAGNDSLLRVLKSNFRFRP